MKRRDFIKKGSAAVATTVIGSTLASCGGGADNSSNKKENDETAGGGANNNPAPGGGTINNPAPGAGPAPGGGAVAGNADVVKTFYITEGSVPLYDYVGPRNVYFRGFNEVANETRPSVPGKSMIVTEGQTVEITIVNQLATDHQFSIDGIPNANSGIVQAGQTKSFMFTATNPGTYLYEDPTMNGANRLIGLHGGFAVMPANSTNQLFAGSRTFVQQQFWIFNDIDFNFNAAVQSNRVNARTPFVPQYFTMNGLSGSPPGSTNAMNPKIDSMYDPRTMLRGTIGDRALVRAINVGRATHSMHIHANHFEWLTQGGVQLIGSKQNDPRAILKDVIPLKGIRLSGNVKASGYICDMIYPFDIPPDAEPKMSQNSINNSPGEVAYPMHLHDEMTQTANGGSYLYGALTDVYFKPSGFVPPKQNI